MKAIIIYESYFGNTEKAAEIIRKTLEPEFEVSVKRASVCSTNELSDVRLLVIGSPTRAASAAPGIKRMLRKLGSDEIRQIRTAVFDTRMDIDSVNPGFLRFVLKRFGFASDKIIKLLNIKGNTPVIQPAGFIVSDTKGPFAPGEEERISSWAAEAAGSILK